MVDQLRSHHIQVTVYETQCAGDAQNYLKQADLSFDLIVAAGGDGTVNEVINGLGARKIPLGVIPIGTANVLAKELQLHSEPKKIVTGILQGNIKPVYFSKLNETRCTMMVGLGFDAWTVQGVSLKLKKRWGKLAYVHSMLRHLRFYGKKTFQVEVDGKIYPAYSVVVTNGRHYGGQYILSRHADIQQDSIQVLIFQGPHVAYLLLYLFSLPLGLVEKMPKMRSLSAKKVKIMVDDGDVVQMDGDCWGVIEKQKPIFMEVEETASPVLSPC